MNTHITDLMYTKKGENDMSVFTFNIREKIALFTDTFSTLSVNIAIIQIKE